MASAVRVAICDDEPSVRRLVWLWVEATPDLEPIGEATEGLEAVELVEREQPDVLVLDLEMPGHSGVFAIEQIRASGATLPIVVYSGSAGSHLHEQALAAGATVFVQKTGAASELLDAIRSVAP